MDTNSKHDAFSQMTEAQIRAWVRTALELPSDFGSSDERFQHGTPDRRWSLGPVIRHRDSGLLEQSNAAVLIRRLESDPSLEGTWEVFGANHWAVGWVDHIAFLAVGEDGRPTRTARVIKAHFDALTDYPVADEEDYGQREHEATLENIASHSMRGRLREDAPDSWASDIHDYLSENDQGAVENRDDQGGCPDDSEFEAAARALGYWDDAE